MDSQFGGNITTGACIQKQENVGYDRYFNVCNGTVTEVPWGQQYYISAVGALIGFVLFVVFIVFVVRYAIKENKLNV